MNAQRSDGNELELVDRGTVKRLQFNLEKGALMSETSAILFGVVTINIQFFALISSFSALIEELRQIRIVITDFSKASPHA